MPDSLSHPSVGTEAELVARAEARKSLEALRLTRSHLEPYVMTMEDMIKWGYFVDIPEGLGGNEPSLEGKVAKCERCTQPFQVKRMEEADNCIYHAGKPYTTKVNGEFCVPERSVLNADTLQGRRLGCTIVARGQWQIARGVRTDRMCFMRTRQRISTPDIHFLFCSLRKRRGRRLTLLQSIVR